MVHVSLSRAVYSPGDEIKVTLFPTNNDCIQLMSVRCFGYLRLPAWIAKEVSNREQYAFRDRPIGPTIPEGSMLLWWTPNFPVHVDAKLPKYSLVKLFVPFFLPPSMKGGLFEVCHWMEVSILRKGEFEMLHKRVPLTISTTVTEMPKLLFPAIGDGFEQFDYTKPPVRQNTAHGQRALDWDNIDVIRSCRRARNLNLSGVFKSRRTFRISFNTLHATEVGVHGEWTEGDALVGRDGESLEIPFRFENAAVGVRRISVRLLRMEWISETDESRETAMWESGPLWISEFVVETFLAVPIPRFLCPTFSTNLCGIAYRLEFDFRATSADVWLEPVLWSLPVDVRHNEDFDFASGGVPVCLPLGTIRAVAEIDQMETTLFFPQSSDQAEIEQVLADSRVCGTQFSLYSSASLVGN